MLGNVTTRKTTEASTSEFLESLGVLLRRARAAAASHGLSLSDSAVLGRLARNGSATAADLARAEGMRPQSMGATIAALEQRRLVKRTPHPTDGRQLLVTLTTQGFALRERIKDAKRVWLAQAIGQLDKREQKTLFAAGELLRRLADSDPA